jgi:hypothetical protein
VKKYIGVVVHERWDKLQIVLLSILVASQYMHAAHISIELGNKPSRPTVHKDYLYFTFADDKLAIISSKNLSSVAIIKLTFRPALHTQVINDNLMLRIFELGDKIIIGLDENDTPFVISSGPHTNSPREIHNKNITVDKEGQQYEFQFEYRLVDNQQTRELWVAVRKKNVVSDDTHENRTYGETLVSRQNKRDLEIQRRCGNIIKKLTHHAPGFSDCQGICSIPDHDIVAMSHKADGILYLIDITQERILASFDLGPLLRPIFYDDALVVMTHPGQEGPRRLFKIEIKKYLK